MVEVAMAETVVQEILQEEKAVLEDTVQTDLTDMKEIPETLNTKK